MSEYAPDICIYHHPCQDGIVAAWAIWKRWGWKQCQFIPASYGKLIHWPAELDGKHILFVDFSLKREKMLELVNGGIVEQRAASVTVLDHHKTAEAELRELPEQIKAIFDMNKSGARLAWEFAHPGEPIPRIVELVEDRDLWRFKFEEESKALATYLRTTGYDIGEVEEINRRMGYDGGELMSDAYTMLKYHEHLAAEMAKHVRLMSLGGHDDIPTVNVPFMFASDVCDRLLKAYPSAPFVASFFVNDEGRPVYSLRSTDDRLDVSRIAQRFGGGGHRNAAGFESPN